MSLLEINNLEKRILRKKIIEINTLKIENGIHGLVGPNGAGKTTLIRCIVGEYTSYKGKININGINAKKYRRIGYLPQNFQLFGDATVEDCMRFFSSVGEKTGKSTKEDVEKCLSLTNMSEYAKIRCRKLSGGMVRRVGIAQAFLNNPEIIIMDEPTVGLDPEERENFYNMIKQTSEDKIVIISSHILEDVERICNKMIVMKDGGIIYNGEIAESRDSSVGQSDMTDGDETGSSGGSYIADRISDKQSIYDRYKRIIKG